MNKTMEKINYLDQYGRNNLTEKPLEYYLEAFEKTDPQIAVQAYLISQAFSNAGIPHRVSSFCSYWEYTIGIGAKEFNFGNQII